MSDVWQDIETAPKDDPESAGRMKERAAIAMWLREAIAATPSPALSVHAMSLADAIERGDHLKEGA